MPRPISSNSPLSAWRLARITAALAPLVLLALVGVPWVLERTPGWFYWQAGLIFLIGLEVAYGVTAAVAILGAMASGLLLVRAGGPAARRRLAARGLLLCLSIVISMAIGELVAAVWAARSLQHPTQPADAMLPAWEADVVRNMPGPRTEVDAPTEFPDPRDDPTIDIAIVGESSAEGVPYNEWISIGRIIEWRLRDALPSRPVRLRVIAEAGYTLMGQQGKLADLQRRPEIMIIYCGHNEFSARFNASRDPPHYFDQELPTTWSLLVERAESVSPLCGLIRRTADNCRVAIPPPARGRRALVDVPAFTPTEYTTVLLDFRRRLEAIVAYAERVGALPVLILPPASDAGYEPNRSYLPSATTRPEREAFARDFLAARGAEVADPGGAQAAYRALLARQPGFAEAHYRLAQLLERAGAWEEAYQHYKSSRDLDGFPMRCLTPFQDAYREVAARHDCLFIDGQSYFHAVGRHGLLDENLFHDAMHPSLRGQIALAQAVLRGLWARGAFGWPKDSPEPIIDPVRCADHFEIGAAVWRRICLWGIMFYERCSHARYDPSTRQQKRLAFAIAAERIEAGEAPESLGLPNIGTPEPVPAASIGDDRARSVVGKGESLPRRPGG